MRKEARPTLELHIEELILHGVAADGYRVGEVLERELTRLFAEQGVPPAATQDGEIAHLDGGAFELQPGAGAEGIGVRLAKAVYGGFAQ